MLEQNIEAHQVHLLEVRIGDPIINMVPRDEGHEFTEEALFLLFLLLTSDQFLVQQILVHRRVVIASDVGLNLVSFEIAVAHIVLRGHDVVGAGAGDLVAYGHASGHNQLTFSFHHAKELEWYLYQIVRQNVNQIRLLRVDIVHQLQKPNGELHQFVARILVLQA